MVSGYTDTVTATIPVGTDPSGIESDPLTNTVYVANTGDNTVSVIGGYTNRVTATITVGGQPFGIGTDPLRNAVYVSNSGDNTLSIISGEVGLAF